MALIDGDDFVSGDLDSFQQNNRMKNHWRQADPVANLGNPQPGMIVSDSDDEKLYHYQAAAYEEIIQTGTPITDDAQIIGGDNSDMIFIPYEETLNDAIIWGLPVSGKRKLIFCDVGDVGANFTGLIGTGADVAFYIVDADTDNTVGVGFNADDTGGIWASDVLHLQNHAGADAAFFAGATAAENPYVLIYGYVTAGAAARYGSLRVTDVNDEFVIAAENNANLEGVTVSLPETNQRFRIRQNADYLSWRLDATDVLMNWSDGQLEFQTDETDATTVLRIKPNGTSEVSQLDFYDADGIRLSLYTAADRGYLLSTGGILGINPDAAQGVDLFEDATSNETPELRIYGFRAADAQRSLEIGVGIDAADCASFDGLSNYYFDGNIGIKTPVPSAAYPDGALLEIEDASNAALILHDTGQASEYSFTADITRTALRFGAAILMDWESNGSIGIGTTTFGANATTGIAMATGAAPTTSPANMFQMWSADVLVVGGKAGPHWRSEEGGMKAWHGGAGTINSFTYQADIADDGTFNLPAITDSAWGFIQAGNNEEYALFTVDDDGDVTLISNSANVVANADIDGNLCIGTAVQEPLVIRNRLGAQKNINLIIWYS